MESRDGDFVRNHRAATILVLARAGGRLRNRCNGWGPHVQPRPRVRGAHGARETLAMLEGSPRAHPDRRPGKGFTLRGVPTRAGGDAVIEVAEIVPEIAAWNRGLLSASSPAVRWTTGASIVRPATSRDLIAAGGPWLTRSCSTHRQRPPAR